MNTTTTEIPPRPARRTLLQLGGDESALSELLAELEGDLTDEETCKAIDQWIAENQDNLDKKLDGYCHIITELQARAEVRKKEAQRLAELARQDAASAQRLKDRLKWFMESRGMARLETPLHKLSVAQNGGKQAVRLLVEPEALPEYYQTVKVEANMDAIRNGLEMQRSELAPLAELEPRGTNLRIR
jgi:hypothetical protein